MPDWLAAAEEPLDVVADGRVNVQCGEHVARPPDDERLRQLLLELGGEFVAEPTSGEPVDHGGPSLLAGREAVRDHLVCTGLLFREPRQPGWAMMPRPGFPREVPVLIHSDLQGRFCR